MASLRLSFKGQSFGRRFKISMDSASRKVRRAQTLAAEEALGHMLRLGRENIAQAGNFGTRWTEGLNGEVRRDGGNIVINLRHRVPYFMVHQRGATIKGRRGLLWIPLPGVDRSERGDFFQRSRRGNLLLFKKEGRGIRPLRVGKESVRIPKRFRVLEIAREVAGLIKSFYLKNWVGISNG